MGCVCVCVLREHDGQVTFSCIFIVCQRLCSFAFPICMALICLYFIHIYIYMHILHLSDVIGWFAMNKVFLFLFFPSYSSKMAVFSFVTGWVFFVFFTLFELSMICYAYCWHIEVNAFPTVITDLILIFNTTLVVCLVFLFRKHKYIFLQIKYCLFYLLLYYYISRVYTKKTFW